MAYPVLRHTLVRLLRWRVRVRGLEHLPNAGPFIIAGNHQSYLDPPTVWLALTPQLNRKLSFITKEYIWRKLQRLFGKRGIEWMGLLPMVMGEKARVLDLALQKLQNGGIVVIFPEGTRNRTGEPVLLRGKTGAARLALATGAPVVPIGITAPAGLNKRQAFKNFFFSLQPSTVTVGASLRFPKTEAVDHALLEQTTTAIMQAIGTLCGKRYPV